MRISKTIWFDQTDIENARNHWVCNAYTIYVYIYSGGDYISARDRITTIMCVCVYDDNGRTVEQGKCSQLDWARERAHAHMSCARTDIDRWLRNQMCIILNILCSKTLFFVSLHVWNGRERKKKTRQNNNQCKMFRVVCVFFSVRCFITPARHLVHNTSQLHAIVCSLSIVR